jgi:hypothetical protein
MSFSRKMRHQSVSKPAGRALTVNEIMHTYSQQLTPAAMATGENDVLLVLDPSDHDARVCWIEPLSATFPALRHGAPGQLAAIRIPPRHAGLDARV